jgi:hypothetical protein
MDLDILNLKVYSGKLSFCIIHYILKFASLFERLAQSSLPVWQAGTSLRLTVTLSVVERWQAERDLNMTFANVKIISLIQKKEVFLFKQKHYR